MRKFIAFILSVTLLLTMSVNTYATTYTYPSTYNYSKTYKADWVPETPVVSWSAPLATQNQTARWIQYIKPDGTVATASPYQAGSVTVKSGSDFYIKMYAGQSMYEESELHLGNVDDYGKGGATLICSIKIKYNTTLSKFYDSTQWEDNGDDTTFDYEQWYVKVTTVR